MARKVLHILSQRPGRTGSGVTLIEMVNHASAQGWEQQVIIGTPAAEPHPQVGALKQELIHPLVFESGNLDFPLPGMSDVMPYRSTVFSTMTETQLECYRDAWKTHVAKVLEQFQPDLIHSHHIWLLSSILKDIAPSIPIVTSCHATGLRQMTLCPHLAQNVSVGCARNEAFCVLHDQHASELAEKLDVAIERIHVVGAGYNESVFHKGNVSPETTSFQIGYAGKYSHAKGLPSLLDAFEILKADFPELQLHIAGSGDSDEANALRSRMEKMAPDVILHGQLSQPELADLLRNARLFVLPSFYEGLPLVVVEAIACGCRVVCTNLLGVRKQIAPIVGEWMTLVDLPEMKSIDQPEESQLSDFSKRLAKAIRQQLLADVESCDANVLAEFSWASVFRKIEPVWRKLV